MKLKLTILLILSLVYGSMILARIKVEAKHVARGGFEKSVIGSTWDPRNYEKISRTIRKRETDAFRNRLIRGDSKGFLIPGIATAQIDWVWLDLLQSVHYESSYENDFSWMFSKLFFIVSHSNPKEIHFARGLAPFYLVIGRDHAGANIVVEEILKLSPNQYQTYFWGGFHAMMNLFHRKMAAWMYRESAKRPEAPQYLASLSYTLEFGDDATSTENDLIQVLEKETDPKIAELIKTTKLKRLQNQKK
jgi:hypothetical protein